LWLGTSGPDLAAALAPLMPGIITDGWLIGAVSGHVMTDGGKPAAGKWKPGASAEATAAVGNLGLGPDLAAALAGAGQAAQQMAHGIAVTLGRLLAEGAAAGLAAAAAGKTLITALADTAKAAAGALGQIVTAIGQAALAWYRHRQVERHAWITEGDAGVCPVCDANAAAGPVRMGDPFPSGDLTEPAHDGCRCATVPAS
jgi:hypothetical protein